MKVIENNSRGTFFPTNLTCIHCHSVLLVDEVDIKIFNYTKIKTELVDGWFFPKERFYESRESCQYFDCPICGKQTQFIYVGAKGCSCICDSMPKNEKLSDSH